MANQELASDHESNSANLGLTDGIRSDPLLNRVPVPDRPHREPVEPSLLPWLRSSDQLNRTSYIRLAMQWGQIKIQTNLPHNDQLLVNGHYRWLIGRSRYCAVVLPNPTISRHHAVIGYDVHIGFYVTDIDSHNGTFLNQQRLSPGQYYALSDGDVVALNCQTIQINICCSHWSLIRDFFRKHH